jgi:tetratricopeptide (TPR) repeat protein
LVVAACGLTGWLVWQRYETHRLVREALRLAEKKSFRDAEPVLESALRRAPDRVDLLRAMALGLLGSERLNAAEPFLTRWIELRPSEAQPYRLRMHVQHRRAYQGTTESEQQRLQGLACADGLRVLELDPDDEQVAQEVIWLCLSLGRFNEADKLCRRWRQEKPNDLWLIYLQARVCHGQGANRDAQTLLDAVLPAQPQFTRGQFLRAILHLEAGEPDRAIPLLRQVIAHDKGHQQEARYQLGLALARTGQNEEAQKIMTEVQQKNLDQVTTRAGHLEQPAVQVRRAELLLGAGEADRAFQLLQAILKEDPRCAAAHRVLASYHDKRGESDKAAEHRRLAEK